MDYPFATLYGVNYDRGNNDQVLTDAAPDAEQQDMLLDENAANAPGAGSDTGFSNIVIALAVVAGLVVFFGVGR